MFISSKIQFSESKSQHQSDIFNNWLSCLSVQRYNFLKANHNRKSIPSDSANVVYQFKDTIFWKQITTISWILFSWSELFISSKIQFSESKSQHDLRRKHKNCGCLSVQRYNFLKANHNMIYIKIVNLFVVYQFKDTIFWKQITT